MKKAIGILLAAVVMFAVTSCDNSLHNTPAAYVTLSVKNMDKLAKIADGTELVFTGDFFSPGGWDTSKRVFKVTAGAGKWTDATQQMIIQGTFNISVCSKGSYTRPWFPAVAGNADDFGKMQNIKVTVPMDGAVHDIELDFGVTPVGITVK